MAKILDQSAILAEEVARVVLEQIEDTGFTAEEAIPGLVFAIIDLADLTTAPDQALDEAANLLADTGEV